MQLPIVPLDTASIEIGGKAVEYRSLTREQVARLADFGADVDAAESFMIASSTGVTLDEAAEWRKQVSAVVVNPLLSAIGVISGLRTVKGPAGK